MSFTPPNAEQLRSLSDFVTMIQGLSKPEIQDAIAQMKTESDKAFDLRSAAANDLVFAQKVTDQNAVDKAENDRVAVALAKDQATLAQAQTDLATAQAKLESDVQALNADRSDFDGWRSSTITSLNARAAGLDDRETTLAAGEQDLATAQQDYAEKMAKLRTLAS